MNHRERFICAFSRRKPDRVPIFEPTIDKPIIQKLAIMLQISSSDKKILETIEQQKYVQVYCDVLERLGLDAISCPLSTGLERISHNRARDKYGRVYILSPHGEPFPAEPYVKSLSEAKRFNMSSKLKLEDFSISRQIITRFGDSRAYCMPLNDPFKESWRSIGGMQNLLLSFRENPSLVHSLLRTSTDFLLKAIDMAVDMGINTFLLVGDFAYESGLLFSLEDYRNYLKCYHVEIVEYVHRKKAMIAKHSDGNVWDLLNDWMEVGFDGLHPIQPQCMDIKQVKEYVGNKMAIIGNIDCRELLVFGTEDEVREAVKATIEKAAWGGGYIISSSNSIHPGCKPENYVAMVEAAFKYGRY